MRIILFSLLLFAPFLGSSQEEKFKLLGIEYAYHYLPELDEFKICKITDINTTVCKRYKIPTTDYLLVDLLEKNKEYFNESNPYFFDKADSLKLDSLYDSVKDCWSIHSTATFEKLSNEETTECKELSKQIQETETIELLLSFLKENSNLSSVTFKDTIIKKLAEKAEKRLKQFFIDKIDKQKQYAFLTSQEFDIPSTEKASQTSSSNTTTSTQLTFISFLLKKESIWLKLQKSILGNQHSEENKAILIFPKDINKVEFISSFYKQDQRFIKSTSNEKHLEELFDKIHDKIDTNNKVALKKQYQEDLTNAIDSLEAQEKTYSGILFLKDAFDVKTFDRIEKANDQKKDKRFNVDYATIRFFNNRINDISILGSFADDTKEKIVLFNENFSYSLRELNRKVDRNEKITHQSKSNKYEVKKKKVYLIYNLADALQYIPDHKLNYSVKNQELRLTPNDSTKVEERQIGDYFTGIIFSDFLGLNSANSNNLIVAEGKIRFPIHLRSWTHWTAFDHISGNVSVNLYNGFNSNSRTIKLQENVFVENENKVFPSLNKVLEENPRDNFDLLVNNNIDAAINFSVITVEWKQANAFFHLNYGIRFLRTAVAYDLFQNEQITMGTTTPTTINPATFLKTNSFQVFSIGQTAGVTVEIRPQTNIGADFNFGLNWLKDKGTNENEVKFFTNNRGTNNIYTSLDLFATGSNNKKKSGVYFRIAGTYNSKSNRVFPQLMAGFATNLSSFVNKLKSDK